MRLLTSGHQVLLNSCKKCLSKNKFPEKSVKNVFLKSISSARLLVLNFCTLISHFLKCRSRVNSYHHQAIKALGAELKIAAISEDNLIEAVFSDKHKFLLGVQWHPEFLYDVDENSKRIVKAFVQSCKS